MQYDDDSHCGVEASQSGKGAEQTASGTPSGDTSPGGAANAARGVGGRETVDKTADSLSFCTGELRATISAAEDGLMRGAAVVEAGDGEPADAAARAPVLASRCPRTRTATAPRPRAASPRCTRGTLSWR